MPPIPALRSRGLAVVATAIALLAYGATVPIAQPGVATGRLTAPLQTPEPPGSALYLPLSGRLIYPKIHPPDMILIPAGYYQMGCDPANPVETCSSDEQPLHTVNLSAYSIDKYEVTNAHYQECVDAGACTAPHQAGSNTRNVYYGTSTYAEYPVINVIWGQANAFCAWAGKRLPTEAEWEKAAKGSSDTRKFPWGNETPNCSRLNYAAQSGACVGDTRRVGSLSKRRQLLRRDGYGGQCMGMGE